MPTYSIFCEACSRKDFFYSTIAERDNTPFCECCGGSTYRIMDLPMISPDITPYVSPNGTLVNSRKQRAEDLKKSNAYAWEPGIEADIKRRKEDQIRESFKPISEAVDSTVRDLVVAGKLET